MGAGSGPLTEGEPVVHTGPRRSWEALLLILILALAAALRLYGLNWDGGHWLHPDERQVYFVTTELGWPSSMAEALSPESPLNPGFFAYGSFPFYLLKLVFTLLGTFWPLLRDNDNLHLVGRPLAVLFDLGTVYLAYRLVHILWPHLPVGKTGADAQAAGRRAGLVAALLVSLTVLHIQLAHFYTPEPLLTFFVLATLNLAADMARSGGNWRQIALGVALGLALATKVSTALLVLVVLVACQARAARVSGQGTRDMKQEPGHRASSSFANTQSKIEKGSLLATARCVMPALLVAGIVFVVVQPYALIDWQTFLGHTVAESRIAWGHTDAPYTRQYASTWPYLYQVRQTALWGLGLPLGVIAWISLAIVAMRWLRRGRWAYALLLAWAGVYFAITGSMYTKYLRYMLPLVPILCVMGIGLVCGLGWQKTRNIRETGNSKAAAPSARHRWLVSAGLLSLVLVSLLYALAYVRIYSERHSWIVASEWIYEHVPAGSTLAVEEWDTTLPLPRSVDAQERRIEDYGVRRLSLYDEPDDVSKWAAIAASLAESDYLIIASRRLYGSIPRLPQRYPMATRYYELLFAGELGYELAGEFTRGPRWLNPRLAPLPNPAPALLHPDESYVVYDHPRALVFRNIGHLEANEVVHRLK